MTDNDVAGAAGWQSGLSAELAQLLEQGEALRREGEIVQCARTARRRTLRSGAGAA
jgi:hypothetical protein